MGRAWRSSSRASTRSPEAGLAISSTAITRPFRIWIPGSGCVCAAFCVSVRSGAVGAEGAIISAGPMLSLPRRGCSLLHKPRRRCVNPLGGEPLTGEPDAGNPPVRFGGREERIQSPLPTPIVEKVESSNRIGPLMLLVIDIGNTNTSLGVFDGENLVAHWRLTTARARTVDEWGVHTRNLFALAALDFKSIDAIAIASVVPPVNFTLKRMAEDYFHLTPLFIDHTVDSGVPILYQPPSDV